MESQAKVVALAIIFMILPTVAVIMRLWVKIVKKARLTYDDYMIFPALTFTLGTGACQLVAAYMGNLGQHLTYTHSPMLPDQLEQLVVFLQAEYAFEILAQLAIVAAKLSLILLYSRIFISSTFTRVAWVVAILVICWHGAFFIAFIFQCTPIAAVWDFELAMTAKCVDKISLWEAYAISDVMTDAIVLSMPIPAVMRLQMATKQKIGVILVFLLGAIVIATGITRTAFFFSIANDPPTDITYVAAPCMYWSFIETSLGTVCACLPTLRPLFAPQGMGSYMGKFRSFMSLRSTSSKGGSRAYAQTHDRTPNGSSPGGSVTGTYRKGVSDFYDSHRAYDAYVDSQPLNGMKGIPTSQGRGGILVSSEIQQSNA